MMAAVIFRHDGTPEPGLRSSARADLESEIDQRLRDDRSNVDLTCTLLWSPKSRLMQTPAPADLRLERGARRRAPSPPAGPPRAPIASLLCCQMRQSETAMAALLVMFRLEQAIAIRCKQ